MWTGESDTKTISLDTNLFKNGATAPFSFENGLVWTGPNMNCLLLGASKPVLTSLRQKHYGITDG